MDVVYLSSFLSVQSPRPLDHRALVMCSLSTRRLCHHFMYTRGTWCSVLSLFSASWAALLDFTYVQTFTVLADDRLFSGFAAVLLQRDSCILCCIICNAHHGSTGIPQSRTLRCQTVEDWWVAFLAPLFNSTAAMQPQDFTCVSACPTIYCLSPRFTYAPFHIFDPAKRRRKG